MSAAPELEFATEAATGTDSAPAARRLTVRIPSPQGTPEGREAARAMWLAERGAARYDITRAIARMRAADYALAALDAPSDSQGGPAR